MKYIEIIVRETKGLARAGLYYFIVLMVVALVFTAFAGMSILVSVVAVENPFVTLGVLGIALPAAAGILLAIARRYLGD